MRCGRTPGVPAPAFGSARRPRWPPRSPAARPFATGAHRRGHASNARYRTPPGRASCTLRLSANHLTHDPHVVGRMAAHVVLPWTHRVFANFKRWALGVYHGLRRKHLHTYLDEFVFRF